jgi:type IV pilus assembly protein PilE
LKQYSGITLIELMIVLAVLSILVAIGYPAYQSQMIENRRTDGQKILLVIMNYQQEFHSRNSRYTLDLINELSLTDAGGGQVASDNNFYLVSAVVCDVPTPIADCVLLTATPQDAQTSDGPMTYNSRNVKTPKAHW